ncbi:MAG TPA: hypothetical protein VGP38_10400 [Rubrobacter sp.]|nr:hypothetical protein [Rubrobacter sp.]
MKGYEQCYNHRPDTQEARRAAASKGGRTGGNGRPGGAATEEVEQVKKHLRGIAGSVLKGTIEPAQGAVATQSLNAVLRALDLQRRWQEADEIEEAIAELERRVYRRGAS